MTGNKDHGADEALYVKSVVDASPQPGDSVADLASAALASHMDALNRLSGVGSDTANVARIYDYYLGGKDNFEVDRTVAEEVLAKNPDVRDSALANREFLGRVVHYLVSEAGVRQFIDLGSGLPTQENVHQVAQAAAADARIVYVDNDPVVLTHARAMLATNQNTLAVGADLRDPWKIVHEVRALIDFTQPIAVLAFAVLHFLSDEQAYGVVNTLVGACPPGSYLAVSHVLDTAEAQTGRAIYARRSANAGLVLRSPAEIGEFFAGLELVHPELERSPGNAPELVHLSQWRNEEDSTVVRDRFMLCGVARKLEP
ncbi:SAM-dependent methyltransferase [Nonomuraea sp. NPDC046802]|uniref:SAM-dependent methyltransferase n=1 Tax=Nonomuraea sp. NPDC046802 TaxID=3154919 RepID=UPI0033E90FCA